MTVNEYYDKVLVINLARRTDRWANCLRQLQKFGITAERFEAYDGVMSEGRVSGHAGCTSSHRGVLELISHNRWPRTLVLEDDFEIVHGDFNQRFSDIIKEVPDDWCVAYLGGHYQEAPQYRVSPHCIRINGMLTTSSYGITYAMARKMAPYIGGAAPIDILFHPFLKANKCYILQPRLMVQSRGWSDIREEDSNNALAMSDTRHENMV